LTASAAPLLEVAGLTHSFGGLCALSGFNLLISPGEIVGLIGPNGAGKTTVFNLITQVYRPDKGSVRFGGRELAGKRPDQAAALGIGRTFQNIRLFKNLSVLDNVRVAGYARSRYSAAEAILRCGRCRSEEGRILDEALRLLSRFGLEGYAREPARNLPYGPQRRLEIARALILRPRLLLLDEPAAGMNPNEIAELMGSIRSLRKDFGVAILMIEHQMSLVMGVCERIVVLDFGETIAAGRPEEVRRDPKVLTAYLGGEEGQ
jgi:branched-chain amino acid transport system ATP-binding protein